MRIAASIAAALLWATLSSAATAAATTVIGPPPPTSSGSTSVSSLRSYYEARLAKQEASYEKQLAAVNKQLAAAKKSVSELTSELELLRLSASTAQVQALTDENVSLKSDYAAVLQSRIQQGEQIDLLKGENAELAAKADATRPPIARDPVDWIVLVAGLALGVLMGLRIGLKRGENRATGGPIPENVTAWWGGDTADTTTGTGG